MITLKKSSQNQIVRSDSKQERLGLNKEQDSPQIDRWGPAGGGEPNIYYRDNAQNMDDGEPKVFSKPSTSSNAYGFQSNY